MTCATYVTYAMLCLGGDGAKRAVEVLATILARLFGGESVWRWKIRVYIIYFILGQFDGSFIRFNCTDVSEVDVQQS